MKFLTFILLLVVSLASPVFASGPRIIEKWDGWVVSKDVSGEVCLALFQYEGGDNLFIGYNMTKKKTVIFSFSHLFTLVADRSLNTTLTVGSLSKVMKAESVQGPKSVGLFIDSPGQVLLDKVGEADRVAIALKGGVGEGADFGGPFVAAIAAVKRCASGAEAENVVSETDQSVLWNDLVAGMTRAEFAAKYPKKGNYILDLA